MKNCIFCQIAKKEIPAHIIYEDEGTMAFLDINPAMKGQAVVISKEHKTSNFKKVSDEALRKTIIAAKKTAKLLDRALNSRSCLLIEGFDIDHLHFKLYPTTKERHLKIRPQMPADSEELKELAEKIITANKQKS